MNDTASQAVALLRQWGHQFHLRNFALKDEQDTGLSAVQPSAHANTVGSSVGDGLHLPVLDIDVPFHLMVKRPGTSPTNWQPAPSGSEITTLVQPAGQLSWQFRFEQPMDEELFGLLRNGVSAPFGLKRYDADDGWTYTSSLPGKVQPFLALGHSVPFIWSPSRTPGHGHLFIGPSTKWRDGRRGVSWDDYLALLRVMQQGGLLGDGFVRMAEQRGQTTVMKPGMVKPREASSS